MAWIVGLGSRSSSFPRTLRGGGTSTTGGAGGGGSAGGRRDEALPLRDPEPPQGRRAPRHRDRGVGTAEGDGDVGLAERARASALLDVEPPAQMASSHRLRRAGGACPGVTTSP